MIPDELVVYNERQERRRQPYFSDCREELLWRQDPQQDAATAFHRCDSFEPSEAEIV